jgi:hypothetical protein
MVFSPYPPKVVDFSFYRKFGIILPFYPLDKPLRVKNKSRKNFVASKQGWSAAPSPHRSRKINKTDDKIPS